MIQEVPGRTASEEVAVLLELAENFDEEARARRKQAALSSAPSRMLVWLELAEISEEAAIRVRVLAASWPLDAEETLSAEFCPVDGCTGCHTEAQTLTDIYDWLRSDPTVCEVWASQDAEDVQRFAMALMSLREGVHAGRWAQ